MNARLERAFEIARELSSDEQDELASTLLDLLGAEDDQQPYRLTGGDRAAVARSRSQAARGEVASMAKVEAVFAKYRR